MRNLFIFICTILFAIACSSCRTVVPDIGVGASEYREIQGAIREGETELAITGTRIEERSSELERSIDASKRAEQELGEVIQRIRARPVDASGG